MSEKVTIVPLVQETTRTRDSDSVVVPINENVLPQSQPTVAEPAAATPAPPPAPVRPRGGRWFIALCALLALLGAVVSFAAPYLRAQLGAMADAWLGRGNVLSWVLDAGETQARDEAMQAVNTQLAGYTARLDRLAAVQQALSTDLGRAVADFRADHRTSESLARAVDDLAQQTKELRVSANAMDKRVRAAGLLTLAMRLRRDLDAGLPIDRDLAALNAAGPYPSVLDNAFQQLRKVRDGAPTMHDLADEFDSVIAGMTTNSEAGRSWASRSWTRVTAMFGGGAPTGHSGLIEHLRALANDGRFTEAANEIMESDYADLGMAWAARVRSRATAVLATQSLLTYSLAAYENAFAETGVR